MFRKTWRHLDIMTGAHTSEKTELTRARRPTHRRLYSLYSWGSAIDVGLSPPASLAGHDGGQLQARWGEKAQRDLRGRGGRCGLRTRGDGYLLVGISIDSSA